MYRFWDMVIAPAFDAARPQVVVEVGSDHGFNTRNLAQWCFDNGAVLHVVDPQPKYDVDEWQERYGDTLVFHRSLSLNALDRIGPCDALLIDGDHNWYTVSGELELTDRHVRKAGAVFPLVFLHDVLWPYGRRDLYYDPETVPEAHRQPYARKGMRPESPDLLASGGLNQHLCNGIYSNQLRNGVLTAVEDFLAERDGFEFEIVPAVHGLGILVPHARLEQAPALRDVLGEVRVTGRVGAVMEMLEGQRLDAEIRHEEVKVAGRELAEERLERIRELQEKVRGEAERARAFEDALRDERREHTRARDALSTAEQHAARAEEQAGALARARDEARARIAELDREAASAAARARDLQDRIEQAERERGRERAALQGRVRDLEHRLQRLSGRRSVRLALRFAGLARPLFRLVRGRRARRSTVGPEEGAEPEGSRPPSPGEVLAAVEAQQPVTVVVPVFNGYEAVARCLASLERNTPPGADVLVIDDASTDERIGGLLADFATRAGFVVLRNDTNLGFVRTVNRGITACAGDVVILNSDTGVGPHWLRNLRVAACLRPDIGTVTPLSTNAGVFSAPSERGGNTWPAELSFDQAARLVARTGTPCYPSTPTGHGFCLYVRRAVFDAVGLLDAEAFPRGYGEETDLCRRASAAGFTHAVDGRTYVFHERGASFGAERDELIRSSRRVLDERYPDYGDLVADLKASPELARARANVAQAFTKDRARAKPRLLYLLHTGTGGTPQTNLDLMEGMQERYQTYLLTSDGRRLRLFEVSGRERRTVGTWELDQPWRIVDVTRPDYRRVLADVLWRYDIDLVHVRHLLGHTLDATDLCDRLGVPVVVSFHDFYLSCPTIHLLDEQDRYCGGVCTPGDGACRIPTRRLGTVPHLKHAWVHEWRRHVGAALRHADALVTTSHDTRGVYQRSYPDLDVPFHVIEHGRDLQQRSGLAVEPAAGEPFRILVPGNVGVNKGIEVIRELVALDAEGRLEFHFLGAVPDGYSDLGVQHGTYEREDFADRVGAIAPSFIAIFSIWPETYCHTLTEAWAAGVPVLATDIGVLRERIRAHGGGWLLDHTDPEGMYREILKIADDLDGYRQESARATLEGIRTTAQMAADYGALYDTLLHARRGAAVPQPSMR